MSSICRARYSSTAWTATTPISTATLAQIQSHWGNKCLALQLPIGAQQGFQGVVDLLTMKAYTGDKGEEGDIPAELASQADQFREKLIESAAETDDALIAKYLEGEELTAEELGERRARRHRRGQYRPYPYWLGNEGDRRAATARFHRISVSVAGGPAGQRRRQGAGRRLLEAARRLVFKTTADPYVGRLSYFRVLSGTFKSDSHVWNANRNADERIGAVYHIVGKAQEQASQIIAGDIGAVAKLAETHTGDTLCARENAVTLDADLLPAACPSAPPSRPRRRPTSTRWARRCTASSKKTRASVWSAAPTRAR